MTKVLIVDDSLVDRKLAGGLIGKDADFETEFAEHGVEAITMLQQAPIDLVLTDLQMPEMDGLELVRKVSTEWSHVPVILMTAHGSEQIAIEALRSGAASYVPKSQLPDTLLGVVRQVAALARADRHYERLIGLRSRADYKFSIENDTTLIDSLVGFVQQHVSGMELCDAAGRYQTGVALAHALLCSMYYSNLELTTEQLQESRESMVIDANGNLLEQRRKQEPYCDRQLHVEVSLTPSQAEFVVRDDGPGYDVNSLIEQGAGEPDGGVAARSITLMNTFMDHVEFNDAGNQVTLIRNKRNGEVEAAEVIA